MMGCAELEHDGRKAREGAKRGDQQDQEAAVILQRCIALDVRKTAARHHDEDQHQIEDCENIPGDQEPRH